MMQYHLGESSIQYHNERCQHHSLAQVKLVLGHMTQHPTRLLTGKTMGSLQQTQHLALRWEALQLSAEERLTDSAQQFLTLYFPKKVRN